MDNSCVFFLRHKHCSKSHLLKEREELIRKSIGLDPVCKRESKVNIKVIIFVL